MKFSIVGCLALAVVFAGCEAKPISNSWVVKVGDHLPDFSLQSIEGKTIDLDSLRGKRAIIAVFGTYCPPCIDELQTLQTNVWEPNAKTGKVAVIAINDAEEPKLVKKFLSHHTITYPILMDPDRSFSRNLGGNFIPRSVVIDAKGRIVALNAGFSKDSIKEIQQQLRLN